MDVLNSLGANSKPISHGLKILADENIFALPETFGLLGEIRSAPGRGLTQAMLRDVDVLLVRSVTRVNRALLHGTGVRFVGSATIGVDHVDLNWLQANGIAFANAPGSNARSVAEYILSCLANLQLQGALNLGTLSVGIIGMGSVGSQVYRMLADIGVACMAYDPLIPQSRYPVMGSWQQVCDADVVCLHTPLTRSGDYPTHHRFDREQLSRLKPGAVLINAGRGPVVDNQALLACLQAGQRLQSILDVWEPEPEISVELLNRVSIATPHIAGYSYDGKVAATAMLRAALGAWLGERKTAFAGTSELPALLCCSGLAGDDYQQLCQLVLQAYDVMADDRRLRAAIGVAEGNVAQVFDRLRKDYPVRREFTQFSVQAGGLSPRLQSWLQLLGFQLID